MSLRFVARVLGTLLTLFCLSLTVPLLFSFYFQDGAHFAFFKAMLVILLVGLFLWGCSGGETRHLKPRDSIIITISSWLFITLGATLPFLFLDHPLTFTDAWFEAMSGITTTGATIYEKVSVLPPSVLFYRQFLQWIGGMGIILLAIAILPLLGVGGMQLYRTEIPGPVKDTKLTPRITETAKFLWVIYIILTLFCILAYRLAGMTVFEAINYGFSTVSIGGFTPHDNNFGHFTDSKIQWVAIFFMLLSAMNFSLHFYVWRRKSLRPYFTDPEWKFFVLWIFILLTFSVLISLPRITGYDSLVAVLFQSLSIVTTTGFTLQNYNNFPFGLLFFLFTFAIVGCCAGSAGGGIKAIRFLLVIKQGYRECKRVVHPHGMFNVRLANTSVSGRVLDAVWGFCAVYLFVFFVVLSLLLISGSSHTTAWSVTIAMLNNLGPALGEAANNYAGMSNPVKILLSFAMLLGRLEVFTFMVLLMPITWR